MARSKHKLAILYPRGKMWWIKYNSPITGSRVRESTNLKVGEEDEEAAMLKVQYNNFLMDRKDPRMEYRKLETSNQAKAIPLRDLFELFMEKYGSEKSPSMQKRYGVFFSALDKTTLPDEPIGNITRTHVEEYLLLRRREDGISNATSNRELAFLHVMFRKAVSWDLLDRNPASGIEKLREASKREVSLSLEQVKRLLDALPIPWDDITEFALLTGFRERNILDLRFSDIEVIPNRLDRHEPAARVTLRGLKGGRTEVFPLSDSALEILQTKRTGQESGYVFPNPITGNPYSRCDAFYNAVRRLGLTVNMDGRDTPLRFHDLRHIHATWLYQKGVDAENRRLLLGHRNVTTTELYTSYDRMVAGRVLQSMQRVRKIA